MVSVLIENKILPSRGSFIERGYWFLAGTRLRFVLRGTARGTGKLLLGLTATIAGGFKSLVEIAAGRVLQ